MSRHLVLCRVSLCYDGMPTHAMPSHAVPCRAAPCHSVPCRAMAYIDTHIMGRPLCDLGLRLTEHSDLLLEEPEVLGFQRLKE